jgi:isocitrate dehydrogenase
MSTTTNKKTPITIAYGDGIGPSIMQATLKILDAAGAQIAPETIDIGEKVYLSGQTNGIEPNAWESLRRTQVFLKAPITTPQGGGYKSLNVSMRKALGLFANIRPCIAYSPFVRTKHPDMNLVIVRENEEDLYAGIEHRQTEEVYQCLKLITRPGCERIVRYAFEYARQQERKRVTCFVKDNIMKLTDGLFHEVFKEIAADYPDIQADSMIVDIGAARVADTPENFDVIVMPNLYGDIISDVAAQIAGSVGMAGSANVGDQCAMFEAIHGSAPDLAGQDVANPSALLHGAIQMLVHIGQSDVAEKIHRAWLVTLEEGLHTADIYKEGQSKQKLGTEAFANAVINNLGQAPKQLEAPSYNNAQPLNLPKVDHKAPSKKELVGIDIFLQWQEGEPTALGEKLKGYGSDDLALQLITNRGVKVWPQGFPETYCVDHWRCRFMSDNIPLSFAEVLSLQTRLHDAGFDVVKTENLYNFDGKPGFAAVHG